MAQYEIPKEPEYNEKIRRLENTDPANANEVFNPLFERIIENVHAVKVSDDKKAYKNLSNVTNEDFKSKFRLSGLNLELADKTTLEAVKVNTDMIKSSVGVSTDGDNVQTLWGQIKMVLGQFTKNWTATRALKLDSVDTTISSRQSSWGATATHSSRIDVSISSRSPADTALNKSIWTDARAVKLDSVDTTVSSRQSSWGATATHSSRIDTTISSRSPADTALNKNVWTDARAVRIDKIDTIYSSVEAIKTATNGAMKVKSIQSGYVASQDNATTATRIINIKTIDMNKSIFYSESDIIYNKPCYVPKLLNNTSISQNPYNKVSNNGGVVSASFAAFHWSIVEYT